MYYHCHTMYSYATLLQVLMPLILRDLALLQFTLMTVVKHGNVPTSLATVTLVSVRSLHLEFNKLHLLVTCLSPWQLEQAMATCCSTATTVERIGTTQHKQVLWIYRPCVRVLLWPSLTKAPSWTHTSTSLSLTRAVERR